MALLATAAVAAGAGPDGRVLRRGNRTGDAVGCGHGCQQGAAECKFYLGHAYGLYGFFSSSAALRWLKPASAAAKNAAHTITMNFMVFLVGAIGYFLTGFALQFGGSGGAAGLGTGGSVLNGMLSIPGFGGLLGYKGLPAAQRRGPMTPESTRCFSSRWCLWIQRSPSRPVSMAERVKIFGVCNYRIFLSPCFSTRCLATGCGEADGCRPSAGISDWGTEPSILPVRPSFTQWAA